jgi:hypothetical protein
MVFIASCPESSPIDRIKFTIGPLVPFPNIGSKQWITVSIAEILDVVMSDCLLGQEKLCAVPANAWDPPTSSAESVLKFGSCRVRVYIELGFQRQTSIRCSVVLVTLDVLNMRALRESL